MSTMSITNLGVNLLSTLTLFNWKSIALISCPNCGEKAEPGGGIESFLKDHKIS
uniref:LITAF domain-containing protein n=1 Tax=Meloidogyne hapla TaxID=6305 RepID=A0A1I8BTB5_MELHA